MHGVHWSSPKVRPAEATRLDQFVRYKGSLRPRWPRLYAFQAVFAFGAFRLWLVVSESRMFA